MGILVGFGFTMPYYAREIWDLGIVRLSGQGQDAVSIHLTSLMAAHGCAVL